MTTASHTEPRSAGTAEGERAFVLKPTPRRSWMWLGIAGWVAAATLTVAVGTFWETILRLRHEIQMRDDRVAELGQRVERDQRWFRVVAAPGARVSEFRPASGVTAAVRGTAVFDPASQRALVVFQEAFPPQGHDYQLWALRGGILMDLGILRPDPTGFAIYRLENMGAAGVTESFTVTLEPKGGSPNPGAPTGPAILRSTLGA